MDIKSIMKSPLLFGLIAVFIWGYLSVLIVMLGNIPPFEMLCCSMTIGFICTSVQLTMQKSWHLMKAPTEMWVSGVIGLSGLNILYISSFQFAPPVHAEIIYYIWPLFIAIGGSIFFKEKLNSRHIMGIALCVLSLFMLHFDNLQTVGGVTLKNMYGYGFAAMGAIASAAYALYSKKYATVPSQIVGLYAGFGAILSLIGHLLFETTVIPSNFELMLFVPLGISYHWASFQALDRAVKHLEACKVSVIAYFAPPLSVTCLTLAGFAVFSWPIVFSCICLFAGSILASVRKKEEVIATAWT